MNSAVDVAIIVDNPNRDLPACVLLAQHLAAASDTTSFSVALVQMNRANSILFRLCPRYVLLNYARPNNAKLISDLQRAGIQIGILDTEGGVFTVMPKTGELNYFNTVIQNDSLRQGIADYFVWGSSIYEAIKKKGLYGNHRLHLTGTPRSDFYHRDFEFLTPPDSNEKIILINTSFPLTNPKFSSFEKEMLMLEKTFGYEKDYLHRLAEQIFDVEKVMVEHVKSLLKSFPDRQFVFRPHPFENEKKYESTFSGFQNIKVICEGTVDQWLRRSYALIHYECSTAIEAACLGIPALSPAGHESIRPIHEANNVTHFYKDTGELAEVLRSILGGSYQAPPNVRLQTEKTLENVYFKVDGKSHVRVATQILRSLGQNTKPNALKAGLINAKQQVKLHIKKWLNYNLPPANKTLAPEKVRVLFEKLGSPGLTLSDRGDHFVIQKKP